MGEQKVSKKSSSSWRLKVCIRKKKKRNTGKAHEDLKIQRRIFDACRKGKELSAM